MAPMSLDNGSWMKNGRDTRFGEVAGSRARISVSQNTITTKYGSISARNAGSTAPEADDVHIMGKDRSWQHLRRIVETVPVNWFSPVTRHADLPLRNRVRQGYNFQQAALASTGRY